MVHQLRVAIPPEEAEEELGWYSFIFFQVVISLVTCCRLPITSSARYGLKGALFKNKSHAYQTD
jgi:hypothetical protein